MTRTPATVQWKLARQRARVVRCVSCTLHEQCTAPVPSSGSPFGKIVIVGEAPGPQEDELGYPFVNYAPSGHLLRWALDAALIDPASVVITNAVKCKPAEGVSPRPYGFRTPTKAEVVACFPHLAEELTIIRPAVIVSLGTVATQALAEERYRKESVTALRKQSRSKDGLAAEWEHGGKKHYAPLLAEFHPSYLQRRGVKTDKRPLDKLLRRYIKTFKLAAGVAGLI